jgi:hypothetical protein
MTTREQFKTMCILRDLLEQEGELNNVEWDTDDIPYLKYICAKSEVDYEQIS